MRKPFSVLMSGYNLLELFEETTHGGWLTFGLGLQMRIVNDPAGGKIVAFQCTRTLADWFFNFLAFSLPTKNRHVGLSIMYESARKKIIAAVEDVMRGELKLTVTGYSQGGPFAGWLAEDLADRGYKVSLVTFGGMLPYSSVSSAIREQYRYASRVVVKGDPATLFPLAWPVLGRTMYLDGPEPGVSTRNHEPAAYREGLKKWVLE